MMIWFALACLGIAQVNSPTGWLMSVNSGIIVALLLNAHDNKVSDSAHQGL